MKRSGLYHFAQVVLPPIFKLFYRYQIIGKENIPETGGLLLCANHTSYKDPVLLGLIQKRPVRFMAKKELFRNRFLSWLIRTLGAFPVERSGGVSAIRNGIDIVKKGGVLGIFIEGTRSKTGELRNPKPGVILLATEGEAPIVPVDIIGEDGKPPRVFRRCVIRVGTPIVHGDLPMEDGSSAAMRKSSRVVMEAIKALRAQTMAVYEGRGT